MKVNSSSLSKLTTVETRPPGIPLPPTLDNSQKQIVATLVSEHLSRYPSNMKSRQSQPKHAGGSVISITSQPKSQGNTALVSQRRRQGAQTVLKQPPTSQPGQNQQQMAIDAMLKILNGLNQQANNVMLAGSRVKNQSQVKASTVLQMNAEARMNTQSFQSNYNRRHPNDNILKTQNSLYEQGQNNYFSQVRSDGGNIMFSKTVSQNGSFTPNQRMLVQADMLNPFRESINAHSNDRDSVDYRSFAEGGLTEQQNDPGASTTAESREKSGMQVKQSEIATLDLPFIQRNSRQKKANNFDSLLANHQKQNYPHVIKEINNKFNGAVSPTPNHPINFIPVQQQNQPLQKGTHQNFRTQTSDQEEEMYQSPQMVHSLLEKKPITPYQNMTHGEPHPKSQDRLKQRRRIILENSENNTHHLHSELGQRIRLQDRKINVIIDVPKDEKLAYTYKTNDLQPVFFATGTGTQSFVRDKNQHQNHHYMSNNSRENSTNASVVAAPTQNILLNFCREIIDNNNTSKKNSFVYDKTQNRLHQQLNSNKLSPVINKKQALESQPVYINSGAYNVKDIVQNFTDASFDQLQQETTISSKHNTLARHRGSDSQALSNPYHLTQSSVDRDPPAEGSGVKKPFRIKVVRGASIQDEMNASLKSNRQPPFETRRDSTPGTADASLNDRVNIDSAQASFVDQIKKKFNEQKYMKRDDVLKLLRQMQVSDSDKLKKKIFDQTEIVKYMSNGADQKLFNMTAQQHQFMNLFTGEKPKNQQQPYTVPKTSQKYNRGSPRPENASPGVGTNISRLGQTQQIFPRPMRDNTINPFMYRNGENPSILKVSPVRVRSDSVDQNMPTDYDIEILVPMEEQDQILSEEQLNSIMKIGLKSLHKFEKKENNVSTGTSQQKNRRKQLAAFNPQPINPGAFLSQIGQYSIKQGMAPDEATALLEIIKADKNGLLTKDINQLKRDLQDYYLRERLAKGCVSKQINLQQRFPVSGTASKLQKALSATGQPRKERRQQIQVYQKDQSLPELRQIAGIIDGCHQNNRANMAEAKIRIILQPDTHLENSEINRVIKRINHFVFLVFKQRAKLSDNQYIQLFKFFNINLPRVNGMLDHSSFKNKEFMQLANEKLLQKLYSVFNKENGNVDPIIGKSNLNYYVGKGNNFYLVRQIIKRRVWWTRASKEDFAPNLNESADEKQHFGCNFIWTQWKKNRHLQYLKKNNTDSNLKIYNRLEHNFHLSNKKALFRNIVRYYRHRELDPFEIAIPLTFHIRQVSSNDVDYMSFLKTFNDLKLRHEGQNVWIIKPGEDTNRGSGIQVSNNLNEIQRILRAQLSSNTNRTMIVQKYIEKPMLVNNRKFDIRCYGLITSINGYQKGFFYRDCYFRTSCKEYNIDNLSNKYIHLTNDAIQKYSDDYGKYENGNKMSINDFQRYLDSHYPTLSINFMRDIFSQIERLVTDTFRSVYGRIDPKKLKNCFELFGYDFMIDENFRVYLIEANTNPCLEISCPLLARIIPEVVDNTFTLALDPLFQPGQFDQFQEAPDKQQARETTFNQTQSNLGMNLTKYPPKKRSRRLDLLPQIKYQLVFDEQIDGPGLIEVQKRMGAIIKDDFNEQELYQEEEEADKATIENEDEDEGDPEDSNN